jgi:hypothetical protein
MCNFCFGGWRWQLQCLPKRWITFGADHPRKPKLHLFLCTDDRGRTWWLLILRYSSGRTKELPQAATHSDISRRWPIRISRAQTILTYIFLCLHWLLDYSFSKYVTITFIESFKIHRLWLSTHIGRLVISAADIASRNNLWIIHPSITTKIAESTDQYDRFPTSVHTRYLPGYRKDTEEHELSIQRYISNWSARRSNRDTADNMRVLLFCWYTKNNTKEFRKW